MYIRRWRLDRLPRFPYMTHKTENQYIYAFDGHEIVVEKGAEIIAEITFEDEITAKIFEFPWANVVNPKEIEIE